MSSIINEEIQKYIDEICGLVRNKKVHNGIKEEITNHIEELTQDYIDVGLSKEKAVKKAIEQMGSAEVVGKDLNKIHKAAPDWITLGLTSIFILVGIFVLWFIQENNIVYDTLFYTDYLKNTIKYVVGAFIVSFIILKFDYRYLRKYSKYIYSCGVILLVATFLLSGYYSSGLGLFRISNRTINMLVISPYIIIIGLSGIFEKWNWNSGKHVIIGLALALIPSILILLAPSIPNFVIYLIGITVILVTSGIKIKHIFYIYGGVMTIGVAGILRYAYRIERIKAWFNPEQYADGAGWMAMKIAELSKNAGSFGKGAELSRNMLPNAHTDYVFTFIVYCFGWIVGSILLTLVAIFIIRIGLMGRKVKDKYGKMIVCGICSLIASQFILAIICNFKPIFSLSVPFLSYGGSSLVINILSVSIISNVFKWRNTPYKSVG